MTWVARLLGGEHSMASHHGTWCTWCSWYVSEGWQGLLLDSTAFQGCHLQDESQPTCVDELTTLVSVSPTQVASPSLVG